MRFPSRDHSSSLKGQSQPTWSGNWFQPASLSSTQADMTIFPVGGGINWHPVWSTNITCTANSVALAKWPPPLPEEQREMPVVGFRSWARYGYDDSHGRRKYYEESAGLGSVGVGYSWAPGINTARCHLEVLCGVMGTTVPEPWCSCGFYVTADLDELKKHIAVPLAHEMYISGAVMGWGKVVQHTEGWRAQYARIVALLDHPRVDLKEYAERYQVPILSRSALERYVREFGDPLPKVEGQ